MTPVLYLFDGYNLLHAGPYVDERELVDALASFVAERGARGVVVFDGVGDDAVRGPLEVRHAPHADTVLERLAAQERRRREVILVTSDSTVADAAGIEVAKISSRTFFRDLKPAVVPAAPPQASPASSTPKRAGGSNSSEEASKQVQLQIGLVLLARPC